MSAHAPEGGTPEATRTEVRDRFQLAARLTELCLQQLEALERRYAPGFVLPRTFAGHEVGADVTADLLFLFGRLAEAGVEAIAGRAPDELCAELLPTIDGAATHSFWSYRVAETLLRRGPFAGNPLLARCSEAAKAQVAAACDTRAWWAQTAEERLPRNYRAVIARCELARWRLGLADDERSVDDRVERLREALAENPWRHFDDSHHQAGSFDIYSADVWLFSEPLRARLGRLWESGFGSALALVEAVGNEDGAAIPWGRSTGALAVALTVELAALAVSSPSPVRAAGWLRRAYDALRAIRPCFRDGVITAHQTRDQDAYRGPARRLQMTLDVLGKLAWSAACLRAGDAEPARAGRRREAYPPCDRLLRLSPATGAAIWSFRQGRTAFVLPFVGPLRSHYLPAPQAPGFLELPVDSELACWTPLILHDGGRWTGGGVPWSIEHGERSVIAQWRSFLALGTARGAPGAWPGRRTLRMGVEGRALRLDDHLEFDALPRAVSLAIPETAARPLRVSVLSSTGHRASQIDVAGIREWRSPWSELSRLHQIELDPAARVDVSIRVEPLLRVAVTSWGHHYHECLYAPMKDRVVARSASEDRDTLLGTTDLFHLHWPEWARIGPLVEHQRLIDELADAEIPVVWTAHNLTPHCKEPEVYGPIYEAWAAAAAAVIHHSQWGEHRLRERHAFAPHCRHVVIPHGHFGALYPTCRATRADAERRLGLPPTRLRVGLIGTPRHEKKVIAFLEGAAACQRDDIQVVCWSLDAQQRAPPSPRIAVAEAYAWVDASTYGLRLAACDAIALPYDPEGEMLTTGVSADILGAGLAALGPSWGYLTETLGEALIACGVSARSVQAALEGLDPERVAQARRAAALRRADHEWTAISARTAELFESVVLDRQGS